MNSIAQKLVNQSLPFTSTSEDCLYLSVYTPAHTHQGSNLPVSTQPQLAREWEDIFSAGRLERTRSAWVPCSVGPVEKLLSIGSERVLLPQGEQLTPGHGVTGPRLLPEVRSCGPGMDPGLTQPIHAQETHSGA